ncbi:hypothetical protein [Klebsiella quasipneumoniae]|uniref:hypothetical protein n=1 Tax=Klebsiella quasipneumoniae TaxID=1463165 RepID=UPI00388DE5E7
MNFVLSMTLICIAIAWLMMSLLPVYPPVAWITPPSAVVFTAEVSPEPGKKHWLHIRLLRFSAQG